MTRKTYDILCSAVKHLKDDEFGICSNIRVCDLFPGVGSDRMLEGTWLFYCAHYNEIFYYTGVPSDEVYIMDDNPSMLLFLYKL